MTHGKHIGYLPAHSTLRVKAHDFMTWGKYSLKNVVIFQLMMSFFFFYQSLFAISLRFQWSVPTSPSGFVIFCFSVPRPLLCLLSASELTKLYSYMSWITNRRGDFLPLLFSATGVENICDSSKHRWRKWPKTQPLKQWYDSVTWALDLTDRNNPSALIELTWSWNKIGLKIAWILTKTGLNLN